MWLGSPKANRFEAGTHGGGEIQEGMSEPTACLRQTALFTLVKKCGRGNNATVNHVYFLESALQTIAAKYVPSAFRLTKAETVWAAFIPSIGFVSSTPVLEVSSKANCPLLDISCLIFCAVIWKAEVLHFVSISNSCTYIEERRWENGKPWR